MFYAVFSGIIKYKALSKADRLSADHLLEIMLFLAHILSLAGVHSHALPFPPSETLYLLMAVTLSQLDCHSLET